MQAKSTYAPVDRGKFLRNLTIAEPHGSWHFLRNSYNSLFVKCVIGRFNQIFQAL